MTTKQTKVINSITQAVQTLSQSKRDTAKPSKVSYIATKAHIELASQAGKLSGTIVDNQAYFAKVAQMLRDAKVVIGDARTCPLAKAFITARFADKTKVAKSTKANALLAFRKAVSSGKEYSENAYRKPDAKKETTKTGAKTAPKTDDAKIYKNTEIQSLITALGLGIKGEDFDPSQLRYHRIVLMTDADVDGAHIRTLLLTFFYRYQKNLIDQGYVYIACPPLYKLERGKNHSYCYSDRELQQKIAEFPSNANYTIQRFKGLGEMMPQQLWDTTMNPETRTLKRVEIEDAAKAEELFTILMGDRVAPRREFIETHGSRLNLTDLDI
ncbi:MAG: hypothetical protein RLZZ143_3130 [Cyanobacteriota bacterium]